MAKNKKEKPIDFKYNLGIYWELIKKYKKVIFVTLLVALVVEATFLADKLVFKELIDKGTEFAAGSLEQQAFIAILLGLAALFVSIIITRSVTQWVKLHMINLLETRLIFDLKRMMFSHLVRLSYSFHTNNKTGSIISRLVRGGRAIEGLTDVFIFNFIPLLFQTIVVAGALVFFDITSALVIILTVTIFIAYSFYINRLQQSANMAANNAEDSEKAVISDIFTNVDSVKYFGKERQTQKKYEKYGKRTSSAFFYHWNFFRWLGAGHTLILGFGLLFLMWFPVMKLLDGTMTIATVVFIFTVYGNIIGPLFGFDHGLRGFYRSMADLESLFEYHKVENEIKDSPNAKPLKIRKGKIEFNDVTFRYKKRYVLRNFSLVIPENKKVAFVGPSGAGKTTIVKLLYRMYDLDKGSITIDGEDIKDVKQESLRSELSIVPQECVLFDDTLKNNIAFSNPRASEKEVFKAMKFAQLDKVVKNFPLKEGTIVGERGVKLSGGEKQRVSIARAILADKKVLVLDEATSALDSETEHEIQQDLARLMKGRTSIIIAHRLSTIMHADIIVVMEKGRVVQKGTHEELINQDGLYKHLWNLQRGGYIK